MSARASDLDYQLDRLETQLPGWMSSVLGWLRKPGLVWVRIPAGILLMAGGVFSFLPVLGLWMLPLGLALLALDIPFLRGPIARMIAWGERKYAEWRGGPSRRKR